MRQVAMTALIAGLLTVGCGNSTNDVRPASGTPADMSATASASARAARAGSPRAHSRLLDDLRRGHAGVDYTEVRTLRQSASSNVPARVDLAFDARARSLTALIPASQRE